MKVITLVGTSIFENFFESYQSSGAKPTYEIVKKDNSPFENWPKWGKRLSHFRIEIKKWAKDKSNASAEIKSLLKIKDEFKENLSIHLIATDTILSPLAAEIIKEWFNGKEGFEVHFEKECGKDVIKGLQVRNSKEFEEQGLMNLFERIEKIIDKPKNTIFNITGGYKTVVPFLTFYAQLYRVPACYIFEDEEELIWLPQLPIEVDFGFIEDHFIAFEAIKPEKQEKNLPKKCELLKYLSNDQKESEKIFEKLKQNKLIAIQNDKVILTIYGKLIYKKFFKEKAKEYQQLKGTFMELKLFEYFYNKYLNEKNIRVYHSKKFGDTEADIIIENNKEKTITVIEVKPGSNIPFKDIKEKKSKKLLPNIKESYQDYQISFEIYIYHKVEILTHLKKKMLECNQLAKQIMGNDFETKWHWLKISDNIYDAQQMIKDTDIKLILGE